MRIGHRSRRYDSQLILAVTFLLPQLSCSSPPPVREELKTGLRIVLLGCSQTDATWPILQIEAAKHNRQPERLLIEARAAASPSPRIQRDMLEALVTSDAAVVCVQPLEPESIRDSIQNLVRRGKPVVVFGRDVPQSGRTAYCGPTEPDMGRAAAAACERLGTGLSNSVMLLRGIEGWAQYQSRYDGFVDSFPGGSGLKMLREVACRSECARLVRGEHHKYPRVAGWVLLDDWPLRALPAGERLLPEGCGIVLCSTDPSYLALVRDGRLTAMLGYDYRKSVQDTVFVAIRVAQAETRGFVNEISAPLKTIGREDLPEWEHLWKSWRQGELTAPSP